MIDRIILRGLITNDRIGVFSVVVDDVAGSLHAVTGVISAQRANILSVLHDRAAADVPIGKARMQFTIGMRGREHLGRVAAALRERGFEVVDTAGRPPAGPG